jgi:hypothetical protein
MSASSTSNFAVGIDKLSLKDNTSRTSSEQPLETAAETQPHPATLLGLPQELRDNIFEHVYEVLGSPDDRIMLMLCLDIYRRRKGFPEAAVPSSQAPPSKNPLLVCRQLYVEMKSMQAAAFRQYWSKTTFDLCLGGRFKCYTPDMLHSVAERDLKHIQNINIPNSCQVSASRLRPNVALKPGNGRLPLTTRTIFGGTCATTGGGGTGQVLSREDSID